jgi:hypothetical protein
MAQLHLAFASPVTAVERKDERKFPNQLGKLNCLAVVVRQLDIWERSPDTLVHIFDLSVKF